MRHGALFNGIGGFQLAAHWMGWTNVWHCEIDKFCNKVVKQHFPNSICYEDIKQFDATEWKGKIDIISGGEPCQPHSVAGEMQGKEDVRYLWPEYKRIVAEVLPKWVVNENVPGSVSNGILDEKISDLEALGYTWWAPFVIPASAVGANHKRERVWLVAHSMRTGLPQRVQPGIGEGERAYEAFERRKSTRIHSAKDQAEFFITSAICGADDAIPSRVDRIKALGNAIVPQIAYEIFRAITTTNQ